MHTTDQQGSLGEACPVSRPVTWPEKTVPENPQASYYRARYYDPNIGRFTSTDPIGFTGGNNHYAFVKNNPLLLRDPKGTCPDLKDCIPPPLFDSVSAYLFVCPCKGQGDTKKTCECLALPFSNSTDPNSPFMKQCKGCYDGKKSPRAACKCQCSLMQDNILKNDAQCNRLCDLLPDKWPWRRNEMKGRSTIFP
jgi:RHS repeat-associated protein